MLMTRIGLLTVGLSLAIGFPAQASVPVEPEPPAAPILGVRDVAWAGFVDSLPVQHSLQVQPASIEQMFALNSPQEVTMQATALLPSALEQTPPPMTPAEILKNPKENLQRYWNQTPPEPKPIHPLEFFALPALESSWKLNVWQEKR
jgi:hypothetical protein